MEITEEYKSRYMTDEFKKPVVDSGALVRLIDLAKVRDARVQRQAARAIFTLTAKEFSKRKLAEHDGLPALISLTRSSNEDIQRDAGVSAGSKDITTRQIKGDLHKAAVVVERDRPGQARGLSALDHNLLRLSV